MKTKLIVLAVIATVTVSFAFTTSKSSTKKEKHAAVAESPQKGTPGGFVIDEVR